MFTSLFLQVQVKSEVFGQESKSSLKSLKNKNLKALLVVMTLLSSVAIRSTKNTAQLYLRNTDIQLRMALAVYLHNWFC